MAKTKHVLNVVKRDGKGTAESRRLRKAGFIPAVIYSRGQEPKSISVPAHDWALLSRSEINLLTLKNEDNSETLALLKEVQNDFIRSCAMHLDFMEVRKDQKITAKVSLHAGHAAPAGAALGGILDQNVHEVEVECLPDDMPEKIEVDVSALNIGEAIHLGDIQVPNVKILGHAEIVAFVVVDPNAEPDVPAAAASAEGEESKEPEVVGAKEKAEKAAAAEAEKAAKK